ncbi:MAG: ABC transporter ATP-binding protein [Spirochaetia bacterium]|jgi:putative ABC transport system ATP-binding protein|nr:ABC transporter ATP-binding protein [Spirochaetia bacterium]
MAQIILSLSDVTKIYGKGETEVIALKDIDLIFEQGEFAAVVGPSGSGKTTLLNIIGCLDSPTRGELSWRGAPMKSMNRTQLAAYRRTHVSFVFQSYNLIPVLTVAENVEMPLLIEGMHDRAAIRERALSIVEMVGLSDKANRYPTELSGGQEQRVAIARALVKKPSIVLADEPTANLDSHTAGEIIKLMREINEKTQTTFLFSTHDPRIMELAQRVITLRDGQIERDERGAP